MSYLYTVKHNFMFDKESCFELGPNKCQLQSVILQIVLDLCQYHIVFM